MSKMRMLLNILGLIPLGALIAGALYIQFFHHDDPCPLCFLQRVGFLAIAMGLLLNILYGERSSHWGLVILSALAGIAVSIRQICLHITTSVGFAEPVLGLHLYTWCFMAYSAVLLGAAIMMITQPEKTIIVFRTEGRGHLNHA